MALSFELSALNVLDFIISTLQLVFQYLIILLVAKASYDKKMIFVASLLVNLIYDFLLSHSDSIALFSIASSAVWLILLTLSYTFLLKQKLTTSLIMSCCNMLIVFSLESVLQILLTLLGMNIYLNPYTQSFVITRMLSMLIQMGAYLGVKQSLAQIENFREMSQKKRNMNFILSYLIFSVLFLTPMILRSEGSVLSLRASDVYYAVLFIVFFYFNFTVLRSLSKAATIEQQLQMQNLYTETLQQSLNDLRGFKHDFTNIINDISVYTYTKSWDDLELYMSSLNRQFLQISTTDIINTEIKENPFLHSVLLSRLQLAELNNIFFRVVVLCNVSLNYFEPFDFSRIIGNLLDNAIEAAKDSDAKKLDFEIHPYHDMCKIIIRNTCAQETVDIRKIYRDGYTTKTDHEGYGLAQVAQLLKKYNKRGFAPELHTNCKDRIFTQELIF